jgi:drug/metabolite transporter (DMT)-like permease
MSLAGVLAALGAAVIWGGMYVVSKVVLEVIPPVTLVAIRFWLSSLLLLAIARQTNAHRIASRRDGLLIGLTGVVGFGLSIVLQFVGTKLTTAANGALVTSASPAFIVLFAWLLAGEPLSRRKLLALALAMAGVIIVINPADLSVSLVGNLALLGAAVTWGLYSVLVRLAVRRSSVLAVSAYAGLAGALMTSVMAPFELAAAPVGVLTPAILLGVLYLALVATALAMFLWNKALALLGAGRASMFFFAQPVAGALLGWLLLGERLDANFFAGGALILLAVALATRPGGMRSR